MCYFKANNEVNYLRNNSNAKELHTAHIFATQDGCSKLSKLLATDLSTCLILYIKYLLFTAHILTCHSRQSTSVTNKIIIKI